MILSMKSKGESVAHSRHQNAFDGETILDAAGIRIVLHCADAGFRRWLDGIAGYRNFLTREDGPADAAVRLTFRGRRERPMWRRRPQETSLRRQGALVRIRHRDFPARGAPDFSRFDVLLPREDVYAFDNLLRFLLSVHAPARGMFLLHAAALVHDGEAYVLYGRSGAGKSTAAAVTAETPGRRCLAEDAVLVGVDGERVFAAATPLLHHPAEPPRPGHFPLRGLFRLRPAPAFCCTPLGAGAGVRSLLPSVLLYEGFHLADRIFELCSDAALGRSGFDLGLRLGEDFWPALLESLD